MQIASMILEEIENRANIIFVFLFIISTIVLLFSAYIQYRHYRAEKRRYQTFSPSREDGKCIVYFYLNPSSLNNIHFTGSLTVSFLHFIEIFYLICRRLESEEAEQTSAYISDDENFIIHMLSIRSPAELAAGFPRVKVSTVEKVIRLLLYRKQQKSEMDANVGLLLAEAARVISEANLNNAKAAKMMAESAEKMRKGGASIEDSIFLLSRFADKASMQISIDSNKESIDLSVTNEPVRVSN